MEHATQVLLLLCNSEHDDDVDDDNSGGTNVSSLPEPTGRKKFVAGEFVRKEAVFRALLRQMRRGTQPSVTAAAEVW